MSTPDAPFVWVLFDFGGVLLTMQDRKAYNEGMEHVLASLRPSPNNSSGTTLPTTSSSTSLVQITEESAITEQSTTSLQSSIDATTPLTPAVSQVNETIPLPGTTAELKKRVYSGPEFLRAKVGQCNSDEMWSTLFRSYQPNLTLEQVHELRDKVRLHGRHVHPAMHALIQALRRHPDRVGVAVLSNYESDLRPVLESLRVAHYFAHDDREEQPDAKLRPDTVFNSSEIGFAKPHADCYKKTMEALHGLTKQRRSDAEHVRFVFIDDKKVNVEAGTTHGVHHGITFEGVEQCVRDVVEVLRGLGVDLGSLSDEQAH